MNEKSEKKDKLWYYGIIACYTFLMMAMVLSGSSTAKILVVHSIFTFALLYTILKVLWDENNE